MCVGERETESGSTTWSVAFLAVGKEKGSLWALAVCVGERETESGSTTWSVAFLAVGKEKGEVQIMSTLLRTVIN